MSWTIRKVMDKRLLGPGKGPRLCAHVVCVCLGYVKGNSVYKVKGLRAYGLYEKLQIVCIDWKIVVMDGRVMRKRIKVLENGETRSSASYNDRKLSELS